MDNAKISGHHWKIMFISGMGFFTDAYDLFIVGVVMTLLKDLWHVGKLEESLVESTALLASALGALLFGRVADMLGRKRIYGVEVLVLAVGAIACAFAPNILWLIGLRFILGIGIGGDYPVSATIMSEYAGKNHRGMMVTLVFAMQAAGLIVGPLFAAGAAVYASLARPRLAHPACLWRSARAGRLLAASQVEGDAPLSARQRQARGRIRKNCQHRPEQPRQPIRVVLGWLSPARE